MDSKPPPLWHIHLACIGQAMLSPALATANRGPFFWPVCLALVSAVQSLIFRSRSGTLPSLRPFPAFLPATISRTDVGSA